MSPRGGSRGRSRPGLVIHESQRPTEVRRVRGLPAPIVNHPVGPYVVDFAWPELGVLVETDGWATHGYRAAFA